MGCVVIGNVVLVQFIMRAWQSDDGASNYDVLPAGSSTSEPLAVLMCLACGATLR